MASRHLFFLCLAVVAGVVLVAACSAPAAPTPTAAPKAAEAAKSEPTKAPEAAKAATAPTAAATKAAVAAGVQKPADWPKKAIKAIVAYDAGGVGDTTMRLLAPQMEKVLGTPIEVVNRPGAGGQVGWTELAKSAPDGYTIGLIHGPALVTTYLDPERKAGLAWSDFAPIGLQAFDPGIMAVNSDSKYKTLKDLVDDAKANPEKVRAGCPGILGDGHIAALKMEQAAGIKFATVQFTGNPPQVTALLGGHIDVGFENVGNNVPMYKAGKIRYLAVMDSQRDNKFLPEIPTTEEQGFKVTTSTSRGLAAPKGTPKEIISYISYALEQAMKDPDVMQKMGNQGIQQRYMGPDEFDKYWRQAEEQVKPLMSLAR